MLSGRTSHHHKRLCLYRLVGNHDDKLNAGLEATMGKLGCLFENRMTAGQGQRDSRRSLGGSRSRRLGVQTDGCPGQSSPDLPSIVAERREWAGDGGNINPKRRCQMSTEFPVHASALSGTPDIYLVHWQHLGSPVRSTSLLPQVRYRSHLARLWPSKATPESRQAAYIGLLMADG